jgi:hypothetical protein
MNGDSPRIHPMASFVNATFRGRARRNDQPASSVDAASHAA